MACLVCSEDASSGLKCSKGHSVCSDCLNSMCGDTAVIKHSGTLPCPWRGSIGAGRAEMCGAAPWTLRELGPSLDKDTLLAMNEAFFATIQQQSAAAQAQSAAYAAAASGGAALAAGAAGAGAGAGAAGGKGRAERLATYRVRLIESHLNLKCPRCLKVFHDFTGCLALTCTCGCGFCGLCLRDCGVDAHACTATHGFPTAAAPTFAQWHLHRQRAAVQQAVAALPDEAAFKADLLRMLEADLSDQRGRNAEKPVLMGGLAIMGMQLGGLGGAGGGQQQQRQQRRRLLLQLLPPPSSAQSATGSSCSSCRLQRTWLWRQLWRSP